MSMSLFQRVVLVFLLAVSAVACSRVPAGHVGVKVYQLGNNKGADTEELGLGRYWIGWNEELYLFPTFTQNYVWTKDPAEGSPNDESISFQTKQGLVVNADVGISYRVDPTKVSDIFQKYRKGIGEITDVYLRNTVRDALVKKASVLDIESVYGEGKSKLLEDVQAAVTEEVGVHGIIIEKVYWVGEHRLPEDVVASINAKIQATQKAQQRENDIQKALADAEIERTNAQGVADAIYIKAKAQADANRLLNASLTGQLVQYRAIESWDGKLPQYNGSGAVPFINVK